MIINTLQDYRNVIESLKQNEILGGVRGMYMNPKQISFLTATQPDKTFIAGIGTGKTSALGVEIVQDINLMPRSHGFLLGNTYKQIISNFLPSLIASFDRMGLIENKHYVVGKSPNKNWPNAYVQSRSFEHGICFCNGSQLSFLAADRKDLNRGGSFQWGKIDEAGLIDEKIYKNIISGRRRGAAEYFEYIRVKNKKVVNNRYRSISRVTSMPFLPSGMWTLKFEEHAVGSPDKFFFIESKTIDNVKVLGNNYIEELRLEMDPLTFAREVDNVRFTNIANGFYPQLNEHHLYDGYGYDETGISSIWETKFIDQDTDPWLPLAVSIDFGANFNCCSVWQYFKDINEERCINAFHVNKPMQLDDMVDLFCEYYRYKLNKDVEIWGDRNGHKSEVNDKRTLFEQVCGRLSSKGFNPILRHDGWENPLHSLKFEFINRILRETDIELPKVRYSKSKSLAVYQSMHNAAVTEDYKKDKSQEKVLGNDPNRYLATDYSDTNDYYLFFRWHPEHRKINEVLRSVMGK